MHQLNSVWGVECVVKLLNSLAKVFWYFQSGSSEFVDNTERWLLHSGSSLKSHAFLHKCGREYIRENVTLGGKKNHFCPFHYFVWVGLHYLRVSWGLQVSWELLLFETMFSLICHQAGADLQLHISTAHEAFCSSACYILRAPYTLIRQSKRRTYVESLWCLVLRLHVQSDMLIMALAIIKRGKKIHFHYNEHLVSWKWLHNPVSFPGSFSPISVTLL